MHLLTFRTNDLGILSNYLQLLIVVGRSSRRSTKEIYIDKIRIRDKTFRKCKELRAEVWASRQLMADGMYYMEVVFSGCIVMS